MERAPLDDAWLGLAFHPDGGRVFSSAGGAQAVDELRFERGALTRTGAIALPSAVKDSFVGGLAVSPDGARLFALNVLGDTLTSIDLATRTVVKSVPLPAEPYAVVASADGKTLFVSLWGGSKVLVVDAATLAVQADIAVGEHPSAMVLTPDGRRLFVACASTNAVWVVDVAETPSARADQGGALSRSAARKHAERPRPVARRQDPAGGERRQQHGGRGRRRGARQKRGLGLHPHRLVPDHGPLHAGRQAHPHSLRQGPALRGEPARPQGAVLHRPASPRDPHRAAGARPGRTRRLHADGLPAHSLHRCHPPRPGRRSRALADPAQGGGAVEDQARVLRDPRESDLRPGPGRRAGRQRRPEPVSLRRGGDAQRARARRRVHALRQLLRERRGERRRPRLLDRRLRQRLRREDLAHELRPPRGALHDGPWHPAAECLRQHRRASDRVPVGRRPRARA